MAITTLSGLLSGLLPAQSFVKVMANNDVDRGIDTSLFSNFWDGAGYPKAGTYDNTLNGVTLSGSSANVTGQIPYKDPLSGNGYIAKISASCIISSGAGSAALINGGAGQLLLCDRLWHNQVANTGTSAQAITSPTWPARDSTGTTNGAGVYLSLACSSGTLNQGNFTIGYTNSAGASGQVTPSYSPQSFMNPGTMADVFLAAGDIGVQSVQSFTWSSAPGGGTWNLVAYRPVAILTLGVKCTFGQPVIEDAVKLGFPRIYNGSVLFWMWKGVNVPAVNGPCIQGSVTFAQG